MRGRLNSVLTRLQLTQPNAFSIHCVCHAIHSCVSDACEQLSGDLEEFLRLVVHFFDRSAKRIALFHEYQGEASVAVHKAVKNAVAKSA